MLLHYFKLQTKIIHRAIREAGLDPWLALFLIAGVFIGTSYFLFSKTDMAGYFMVLISLGILTTLSGKERNDFLRVTLPTKTYRYVRILENCVVILPFMVVLAFHKQYIPILILIPLSFLLPFQTNGSLKSKSGFSPFGKRPFEFASGMRQSYPLYLAVSLLFIPAFLADNSSMGVFILGMYFMLAISFYTPVENEILVWMHDCSPKKFLRKKLTTALLHMSLLVLPVCTALLTNWPETWWMCLLIYTVGGLLLFTLVLAKYAAFPKPMNVPEGIVIAISISFPPMMIVAIPYFFKKAKHQLHFLLHDSNQST